MHVVILILGLTMSNIFLGKVFMAISYRCFLFS